MVNKSMKILLHNIASAVGYATPPCVSRELAENCHDYVTTVVMQGDIIPRLSVASLTRLRNEIMQTNWMSVFEKEDWRSVVHLVTNAKQVMSSVQDVARKVTDYAKFRSQRRFPGPPIRKEPGAVPRVPSSRNTNGTTDVLKKQETAPTIHELFVPGTLYYLKRNVETRTERESE